MVDRVDYCARARRFRAIRWLSSAVVTAALLAVVPVSLAQERPKRALSPEALAQQVVERTNAVRAENGLPPLKLQKNLTEAARWLAQDMATKGYFDHQDQKGRNIDPRLPDFGYTGYQAIGENIAAGQPTPEAVVDGWMKSPGHRRNILNRDFREIGIGYFATRTGKFRRYWVQDFGARFDVYPVVINGEAAETRKTTVRLAISGEGWAERMRLSNDGETWTKWEPYRAERPWILEEGKGTRTVFVELRGKEETRRAQDSIELLSPLPEKESGKTREEGPDRER